MRPPQALTTPVPADGRLDSWKEIAAYLKRDIRTVQRWEKLEGLPVRRHQHQKRGSAFAYRDELDAWWQSRGHEVDLPLPADAARSPAAEEPQPVRSAGVRFADTVPWVIACAALAAAALSFEARSAASKVRPVVERFQLLAPPEHSLTPSLGLAMSPDGQRLALRCSSFPWRIRPSASRPARTTSTRPVAGSS